MEPDLRLRPAKRPAPSLVKHPAPFRRKLLRWYAAQQRPLPWRKNRDFYRVLVSEFMLQQTQVKTVIPYYENFLKRFPSLPSLAKAPEEKVLSAWAGLGYYRRARFLHAAAKAVVREGLPKDAVSLKELPGVGAYTAAAIASISFGWPLAVLDGNVMRVLSRLFALDEDPKSRQGSLQFQAMADTLLDPKDPGAFNQAMMELGAIICSPKAPACSLCPLAEFCRARAMGDPEAFPKLRSAPKATELRKLVLLVRHRDALLCRERETGPRFQGFWHFPEVEMDELSDASKVAKALAKKLLGDAKAKPQALARMKQSITRYRIQVEVYECWTSAKAKAPWQWRKLSDLEALPLASNEKKITQIVNTKSQAKEFHLN